jgi:6-phosphogluconolactonase (cycloisomerase 2 family)
LYVLTQGSNGSGNNVSSFAIDLGSGNLSLINSNASTCATAGTCGLPLQIVLDPTGGVAFVLNQNAISSYTVNSDGTLGTPTAGPSFGSTAIAMTRDAGGNFLYVITQAPELLVYSMKSGSTTLTQVNDVSLTRLPTALSAITLTSPAEELVFITSNKDLSQNHNDNTVSVYGIGTDGTVTEKIGSPYATTTIDPLSVLAVNTNPAGQNSGGVFVYAGAAGNASGALDSFKICTVIDAVCTAQSDVDSAKLLPIGTPTSTGQNPVGMVVDPTNNFLYVVCEGSNQVFGFRINTTAGTLTSLSPANEPTGSQPVAMAMHSSGKFLYTSNINASNISGFTVSTITGSMSSPITVNSPAGPSGMTAR